MAAALAAAFFLWHRGAFLARCSPWSRWTAEKTEEAPSGDRIFRILLKNRPYRSADMACWFPGTDYLFPFFFLLIATTPHTALAPANTMTAHSHRLALSPVLGTL